MKEIPNLQYPKNAIGLSFSFPPENEKYSPNYLSCFSIEKVVYFPKAEVSNHSSPYKSNQKPSCWAYNIYLFIVFLKQEY